MKASWNHEGLAGIMKASLLNDCRSKHPFLCTQVSLIYKHRHVDYQLNEMQCNLLWRLKNYIWCNLFYKKRRKYFERSPPVYRVTHALTINTPGPGWPLGFVKEHTKIAEWSNLVWNMIDRDLVIEMIPNMAHGTVTLARGDPLLKISAIFRELSPRQEEHHVKSHLEPVKRHVGDSANMITVLWSEES